MIFANGSIIWVSISSDISAFTNHIYNCLVINFEHSSCSKILSIRSLYSFSPFSEIRALLNLCDKFLSPEVCLLLEKKAVQVSGLLRPLTLQPVNVFAI